MRLSDIIGMLQQYFVVACLGLLLIIALFSIGYFIFYKRLLKGRRRLTIGRAIILLLLTGYLLVVLYATLFSRGEHYPSSTNFHFFSSYLEAWNGFSLRSWQLLIFNIAFFIPLGVLLPLFSKKFEKVGWIVAGGFLSTLLIESIQLLLGWGIFELDDIFNNFLGVIIGYGLVMAVLTIAREDRHKGWKVICYLLPVLLVLGAFSGVFIKYEKQDFGNLALAHHYRINCENADFEIDVALSDTAKEVMTYSTVVYDKESALQYAKELYTGFGVSFDDIEIDQYNDNALYKTRGAESHSLWIQYRGGTYRYTDFSHFDAEPAEVAISEAEARALLKDMNVFIPEEASFSRTDRAGEYWFDVNFAKEKEAYYAGTFHFGIYGENEIKTINNNLILLEEYQPVEVKSQIEALAEIKQGKFRIYMSEEIHTVVISDVALDYTMDSKGYYQPVYEFDTTINGDKYIISIPAMKS